MPVNEFPMLIDFMCMSFDDDWLQIHEGEEHGAEVEKMMKNEDSLESGSTIKTSVGRKNGYVGFMVGQLGLSAELRNGSCWFCDRSLFE
jgi:hypothetical protein